MGEVWVVRGQGGLWGKERQTASTLQPGMMPGIGLSCCGPEMTHDSKALDLSRIHCSPFQPLFMCEGIETNKWLVSWYFFFLIEIPVKCFGIQGWGTLMKELFLTVIFSNVNGEINNIQLLVTKRGASKYIWSKGLVTYKSQSKIANNSCKAEQSLDYHHFCLFLKPTALFTFLKI